jgi:hypothetical protein
MADRIEQEFYRSSWQRVLSIGPDGIQPYVRPDHRPARIAGRRRVAAMLRALAQGLSDITEGLGAFGSFGRWGATGSGSRAMAAGTTADPSPPVRRVRRRVRQRGRCHGGSARRPSLQRRRPDRKKLKQSSPTADIVAKQMRPRVGSRSNGSVRME